MTTIGQVVVLAGCILTVLAGVGVVRFNDVLGRMHALSKASTLGFVLVMIGAAACIGHAAGATLLLAAALQCFTIPVGANMISRAVYRDQVLHGHREPVDELADEDGEADDPVG